LSVTLFIPCFIDQGAPRVAEAVVQILERLGAAWHYPEAQTCCGQFAWTVGDLATARRLARHFLRVFGAAEAVLCPSASCAFMVRRAYPKLAQDSQERRDLEEVAARVWELSEWLATQGMLPWTPRYDGALVLHQSCKARQLGVLPAASRVLSQVAGLKLAAVSPYYTCCGFGGTFKAQHPDLSRAMGEAYLRALRETGAAGLVSLDYSCLMHLKEVASGQGGDLKFFHLAELLLYGRS
jgi:L-lactate dehydrogenase complex protein LldE